MDGRPKREGVRFVPHPTQSLIVKRIFERYRDGDGKHAIATILNNEGVPSAGSGGSRNGRANSGTWSTASIKGIVENELYAGTRIWNRTSRVGEKHPNSGEEGTESEPRDRLDKRRRLRPPARGRGNVVARPATPQGRWREVQAEPQRERLSTISAQRNEFGARDAARASPSAYIAAFPRSLITDARSTLGLIGLLQGNG